MKNIIIFYEHIKREYKACHNLKKMLEKNNETKVFLFSIQFEYIDAIKIARKYNVSMVIMPWIYTEKDYQLMYPFLEKNSKLYIVNLHHEQIGYEASEKMLLPADEFSKNSVFHFCWGEYFKEKLIESGVKEELIYITGNIRGEKNNKPIYNRSELAQKHCLDITKKWILFAENRGWVLSSTNKKDEFLISLGFDRDAVEERKKITLCSIEKTLEELDELDDAFFESYELIYRPHPGTEVPKTINNRVKVINEYSMFEWLSSVDVNVVWSSTTIFESDAMKVPSFVYEPTRNPKKFKTYGLEGYQTIKRLDEIDNVLIDEYYEHIAPKNNYEKLIGKIDGKSLENTKDAIFEIMEGEFSNYHAHKAPYSIRWMSKRYIFDKVTKIIAKVGILSYIKFPRTSYQLRDDIPYINNNTRRSIKSE